MTNLLGKSKVKICVLLLSREIVMELSKSDILHIGAIALVLVATAAAIPTIHHTSSSIPDSNQIKAHPSAHPSHKG